MPMSSDTKYFTGLFVDNEFHPSASGNTFETVNPNNKTKICDVANCDAADVDRAVKSSRKAFPSWSATSPKERQALMMKIAEMLEAEADAFAELEALDSGKPVAACKAADIPLTANTIRYYAGHAVTHMGDQVPMFGHKDHRFHTYTRKEAVGVVAAIIPWNFPLAMLAWKLGPALAAGCTVILKPSEKTPLTALKFADLTRRAGLPNGVLNVVPGYGPSAGSPLVLHPQVDKIAFTGSSRTGKIIKKMSVDTDGHLRRLSLELGGKSPLIVLADADLEQAVETACFGLFFNCGQCCIASSRVYVHSAVYDKFLELAKKRAEALNLGDQMCAKTTLGPIVDSIQYESVCKWIEKGKNEGARVLTGGGPAPEKGGFHVQPTIFCDVNDDMSVVREEIFGPVMCVAKFTSMNDVIERANDTRYGLGAGICTRDIGKAHYLAAKLRAGTVYVNCWDVFDPAAPFGGFKDSGIGRELGAAAMELYTENKTVICDLSFKDEDINCCHE